MKMEKSHKSRENNGPAKVVALIFNPTFELTTGGSFGSTPRETNYLFRVDYSH